MKEIYFRRKHSRFGDATVVARTRFDGVACASLRDVDGAVGDVGSTTERPADVGLRGALLS